MLPKGKAILVKDVYGKHQWVRNEDGTINDMVWDYDYHNGPHCERCGACPCMYCEPDYDDKPCVVEFYQCPNCGKKMTEYYIPEKCPHCGTLLDTKEYETKVSYHL